MSRKFASSLSLAQALSLNFLCLSAPHNDVAGGSNLQGRFADSLTSEERNWEEKMTSEYFNIPLCQIL